MNSGDIEEIDAAGKPVTRSALGIDLKTQGPQGMYLLPHRGTADVKVARDVRAGMHGAVGDEG
ncbi:MAG: hypothetical protein R3F45_05165 [Gammaproteobacteria bacterium]